MLVILPFNTTDDLDELLELATRINDQPRYKTIAYNVDEETIYYYDSYENQDVYKAFRKHQMGEDMPSSLEEASLDEGAQHWSIPFNTIDEAWNLIREQE